MIIRYKDIHPIGISFKVGEFQNNETMVEKLPRDLKSRILEFLKSGKEECLGLMALRDPITNEVYKSENIVWERDGYSWSDASIYMLEKYDVRLSDEFLKLFS